MQAAHSIAHPAVEAYSPAFTCLKQKLAGENMWRHPDLLKIIYLLGVASTSERAPDWAGIKLILASPPCRISNQICPSLSHWRESTRVARSSGHSLEKKVVLDLVVVILVLVRSLVKDYTVTIAKSGNFWKLLKSVYRRDQEMLAESERNIANPFDWPSGESAVISSR